MKRLFIVIVGLAALILGLAFLVDAVNLDTERADRWGMTISFAVAMFSVGVMSSTNTPKAEPSADPLGDIDADRSQRFVPAAPGSLKTETTLRVPRPVADLATTVESSTTTEPAAAKAPKAPPLDWSILLDKSGVSDPPAPAPADHGPDAAFVADAAPAGDEVVADAVEFADSAEKEGAGTVTVPILAAGSGADEEVEEPVSIDSTAVPAAPAADTVIHVSAADTATHERPTGEHTFDSPAVHEPAPHAPASTESAAAIAIHRADDRAEEVAIHRMAARGEVSTAGPLTTQDLAMMLFLSQADDQLISELASRSEPEQVIDLSDSAPASPGHTIAG